jgi:hypothetical protein
MGSAPSNPILSPSPNILTQLQGVYYGLVHLGLATAAYTYESAPDKIGPALQKLLEDPSQFPPIPDPNTPGQTIQGYWKLDWGPSFETDLRLFRNDNLIYVASYRQGQRPAPGGQDGPPYFFAVVNRGTDTSAGFFEDIVQAFEDLDAFEQVTWIDVLNGNHKLLGLPLHNPANRAVPSGLTGKIAEGTADALIALNYLIPWNASQFSKNYLGDAMLSLMGKYPNTPVVVTGHSLGGALTQVVACYLAWQLYNTQTGAVPLVIPQPIAPPTVGDSNFVSMYDTLFPNATGGNFWFNTADLVPCAWANLKQILTLWDGYQWPTPPGGQGPGLDFGLKLVLALLFGRVPPYSRPLVNQQSLSANPPGVLPSEADMRAFLTKTGGNPNNWNTWASQLQYQHLPPVYHALMSVVSGVQAYPQVSPPQAARAAAASV